MIYDPEDTKMVCVYFIFNYIVREGRRLYCVYILMRNTIGIESSIYVIIHINLKRAIYRVSVFINVIKTKPIMADTNRLYV